MDLRPRRGAERIDSAYPYSADGRFPTLPTQPYLEPLTTLGFLAGITRRVRLGIAVLILPYRHPLLTAKMGLDAGQPLGRTR